MEKTDSLPQSEAELAEKLKDRWWRINHLYKITNEHGKVVTFKCRPVQRLFYLCMWWLNIILKSRQHGFTTFIAILILDMCLFNSNTRGAIIAHRVPDAKRIFRDKILFPYDHLPAAIRDKIPAIKRDGGELLLSNNSGVCVDTSVRSGTFNILHVTEFGKICARYPQKAEEIKTGSLETVHQGNFIFIESTAEGDFGDFRDRCIKSQEVQNSGQELGPMDFKFFFFPWYDKPDNTTDPKFVKIPKILADYFTKLEPEIERKLTEGQKAWYAKKYESLGPVLIKREHPSTPREAFEASIEGSYWGEQIGQARDEGRIGFVPYDPNLLVYTTWDLGISDSTAIWFWQVAGKEIRLIEYYEDNGKALGYYIQFCQRKPYIYGAHFAPHDIKVRELGTGLSRLETASNLGFIFIVLPTNTTSIQDGIDLVRGILNFCWFDNEKCAEGIKAAAAYRKEFNEKMDCYRDTPLHDWSSHGASALRYVAIAYRTQTLAGKINNQVFESSQTRQEANYNPMDYAGVK